MANTLVEALSNRLAMLRLGAHGKNIRVHGRLRILSAKGKMSIGRNVTIQTTPVDTELNAGKKNATLIIGDGAHIGYGCTILAEERAIEIGPQTWIGPYVRIVDTNYHSAESQDLPDTNPMSICIGSAVRIGAWSIIMKGSTIGDRAVIHPGSVVSGAVPAGETFAGNPARNVRRDLDHVNLAGKERMARFLDFLKVELNSPAAIDEQSTLEQVLELDSLRRISFLIAMEESFAICVSLDTDWASVTPEELLLDPAQR